MTSMYDIGIKLSLDSSGVSSGVMGIMSVFQRLHTQVLATGGSMDAFNRSMGMMAGGMALTGAGMAGIGVMRGWANAAGQMQDQLVQVGIAAKGTQAQLQALYSQSFAVAGQTQFSAPVVLGMEQTMARMGFRDPTGKQTQRQVIGSAIPDFARAAEIDAHFMHQSAQSTVEALTQQAHMFGAYSGAALSKNVALATGAGLASGMTTSQQSNVLRYLMPAVKSLGVPAVDAYALAALANQTGLTMGRGGSNLGALFRYMTPGGSKAHQQGLAQIEQLGGGSFFNQQGQFAGIPAALGVINRFMDNRGITPEQRMVDLNNAFKVQGAQAASVLGNDTSMRQFGAIRQQILPDTPAWMKGVQGQLNAVLPGQLTTLQTNLQSISALLGAQLLPALAPVIHGLVELTTGVLGFLRTHEGIARFVVTFTAVSTAAALIAGPIFVAAGAFGVMAAAGVTVDIAFLPLTATILGVIAAIGAMALVIQNWDTVTAALTGRLGPLWQGVGVGVMALMPITGVIGGIILVFKGWNDMTRTLSGTLSLLPARLGPLWQGVGVGVTALMPIAGVIGGIVLVFEHWSQITDTLGRGIHNLLVQLGLLHAATSPVAQVAAPTGAYHAGQVQASMPTGGTVGMPTYLPIKPIGGGASPEHWMPATQTPIHAIAPPVVPAGRGGALPERWMPGTLTPTPMARAAHGPSPRHGATPPINLGGVHIGAVHVHDAGAKSAPQLAKEIIEQLPREALDHIARHVKESFGTDTTMGQQYQAGPFTGLELAGPAF